MIGSKSDVIDGFFWSNFVGDDYEDKNIIDVKGGEEEVINVKFVIGCDGVRSWIRWVFGFEFEL